MSGNNENPEPIDSDGTRTTNLNPDNVQDKGRSENNQNMPLKIPSPAPPIDKTRVDWVNLAKEQAAKNSLSHPVEETSQQHYNWAESRGHTDGFAGSNEFASHPGFFPYGHPYGYPNVPQVHCYPPGSYYPDMRSYPTPPNYQPQEGQDQSNQYLPDKKDVQPPKRNTTPLSSDSQPGRHGTKGTKKPAKPCRTYSEGGFCPRGMTCHYSHDYKKPIGGQSLRLTLDYLVGQQCKIIATQNYQTKTLENVYNQQKDLLRSLKQVEQRLKVLGLPSKNLEPEDSEESMKRSRSQSTSRKPREKINTRYNLTRNK